MGEVLLAFVVCKNIYFHSININKMTLFQPRYGRRFQSIDWILKLSQFERKNRFLITNFVERDIIFWLIDSFLKAKVISFYSAEENESLWLNFRPIQIKDILNGTMHLLRNLILSLNPIIMTNYLSSTKLITLQKRTLPGRYKQQHQDNPGGIKTFFCPLYDKS